MVESDAGGLGYWSVILFAILYPCVNIGLIVLEWHMGAGVMNWIENAPYPVYEEAVEEEEELDEDEAPNDF